MSNNILNLSFTLIFTLSSSFSLIHSFLVHFSCDRLLNVIRIINICVRLNNVNMSFLMEMRMRMNGDGQFMEIVFICMLVFDYSIDY